MVAAGVDLAARRLAAQVLRDFLGGKITNDAFVDAYPQTFDPVIGEIWESAWVLYDDFRRHRLTGKYALHPDTRRGCLRWVLFLDSDLPYTWPPLAHPGFPPPLVPQGRIVRLFDPQDRNGRALRLFRAHGAVHVWPFASVADYRRALAQPRRLAGARSGVEKV